MADSSDEAEQPRPSLPAAAEEQPDQSAGAEAEQGNNSPDQSI